jgi:hypothetical protein
MPSSLEATLDHEFALEVGQVATISSEQLQISFDAVTEDSRCPIDAECFWEGRVTVEGTIRRESQILHTFTLSLYGSDNRATEESKQIFDAYAITFVAFHPKPVANPDTSAPSPAPPTATFIVKMRDG